MLPQVQHAADVLPQSCVKGWQLCWPLIWTVDGAQRGVLRSGKALIWILQQDGCLILRKMVHVQQSYLDCIQIMHRVSPFNASSAAHVRSAETASVLELKWQ